jgi:hypothetical protein
MEPQALDPDQINELIQAVDVTVDDLPIVRSVDLSVCLRLLCDLCGELALLPIPP